MFAKRDFAERADGHVRVPTTYARPRRDNPRLDQSRSTRRGARRKDAFGGSRFTHRQDSDSAYRREPASGASTPTRGNPKDRHEESRLRSLRNHPRQRQTLLRRLLPCVQPRPPASIQRSRTRATRATAGPKTRIRQPHPRPDARSASAWPTPRSKLLSGTSNTSDPLARSGPMRSFPSIQGVSLNRLAAATGLSKQYLSRVRRGLATPHPRNWKTLHTVGCDYRNE